MRKNKKVLFICKKRVDEYGISYGLVNSATFVSRFLNHQGIESKVVVVQDGNCVDKEVTDYNPTHVIIEALWVTPAKMLELLSISRHHNRKWAVRIHSKVPFIANEGIAMDWLSKYATICNNFSNFVIAPNSDEFSIDIMSLFRTSNIVYLPNIYFSTRIPKYYNSWKTKSKGIIDVGCFGAIRPLKNTLIQAIAAIKYADEHGLTMFFHINGNRQEQKGDQVYKNVKALFAGCVYPDGRPRHYIIEHDWMCHDDFLKLIDGMDVGMQVSLSETFNIVIADFVSRGVPVVYSNEIDWLPSVLSANPNSSESIKKSIDFNLKFKNLGITSVNKWFLSMWNKNAEKKWLKFIH